MTTITLQLHDVADQLPDADTDVLIWDAGSDEAQLGAYVGHDEDGAPVFVDAHGCRVEGASHWADMPRRPR